MRTLRAAISAALRFAETRAARRGLGALMIAFGYVAAMSLSAELGIARGDRCKVDDVSKIVEAIRGKA